MSKPRVNLTRFHGVFAPNSNYRALVTPAKRGKGNKRQEISTTDDNIPVKRHAAMIWAKFVHGHEAARENLVLSVGLGSITDTDSCYLSVCFGEFIAKSEE